MNPVRTVHNSRVNGPRLYCPHIPPAGEVTLDPDETRHALGSLRLRPGAAVTLMDGCGHMALGRLIDAVADESIATGARRRSADRRRSATVRVDRLLSLPAPERTLTLVVAACKGQRLTWMVEKCTELGVTRIQLTNFRRSVVRPGDSHLAKLRRTALQACKQCGRVWLPEISWMGGLSEALTANGTCASAVAEPARDAAAFPTWLHGHARGVGELAVVVGPEGGLSDDEAELLNERGACRVRLAAHILRVETAAVCVASNWAAWTQG